MYVKGVETSDTHIFAYDFLNIQPIFNPKKVSESWEMSTTDSPGSRVPVLLEVTFLLYFVLL